MKKAIAAGLIAALLTGCSTLGRIQKISNPDVNEKIQQCLDKDKFYQKTKEDKAISYDNDGDVSKILTTQRYMKDNNYVVAQAEKQSNYSYYGAQEGYKSKELVLPSINYWVFDANGNLMCEYHKLYSLAENRMRYWYNKNGTVRKELYDGVMIYTDDKGEVSADTEADTNAIYEKDIGNLTESLEKDLDIDTKL